MKQLDLFLELKKNFIPSTLEITSVDDAEAIHQRLIQFRVELHDKEVGGFIPHYRGEQKYGWDIIPGVFRTPLHCLTSEEGRALEKKAIFEFERTINEDLGHHILRKIHDEGSFGRTWDLLFQAQHAGIRTTLTDWSFVVYPSLFFATEYSPITEIESSDAQFWYIMVPESNIISDTQFYPKEGFFDLNPFAVNNIYMINPSIYITDVEERLFEYNMYKQKGRFLVLPNKECNTPINQQPFIIEFMHRIRVPAKYKESIRQELAERGLTRKWLFYEKNSECEAIIKGINKKIYNI